MSANEFIDLSNKLNKVLNLVELLVPATFTLSYIAEITNTKRETIYKYVTRNYIKNMDFYIKNGRITVSRDIGLELIRRYKNAKQHTNL